MHEADEIGDFLFPAGQQSVRAVEPRVSPFHLPAAGFAAIVLRFGTVIVLGRHMRFVTTAADLLFNGLTRVPKPWKISRPWPRKTAKLERVDRCQTARCRPRCRRPQGYRRATRPPARTNHARASVRSADRSNLQTVKKTATSRLDMEKPCVSDVAPNESIKDHCLFQAPFKCGQQAPTCLPLSHQANRFLGLQSRDRAC